MNDPKEFWKGLSDFWINFENRSEIEDFWYGMLEAFRESSKRLNLTYITKYSEYSIPIWEEKYQSIEVIPSGPFSNKIGTNSEYPLPEDMKGTYNIPTLESVETGQNLIYGTDYSISNEDSIIFSTALTENPYGDKLTFIANTSKRIDPSVYNLFRNISGMSLLHVEQSKYHPFTFDGNQPSTLTDAYKDEKVILIKYMSWAVFYLRKQLPTIKNMKWLYNVLFNLPFAYEGGTANISGNTCTIGNFSYYIDSGSWGVSQDEVVKRFQPLINNITIYDRINNLSLINSTFSSLQRSSGIVVDVQTQNRSDYMQTIIDDHDIYYSSKGQNLVYNIH